MAKHPSRHYDVLRRTAANFLARRNPHIERLEPRQLLSAAPAVGGGNLGPSITSLKTPDVLVPFDTGTVEVGLNNSGTGLAAGVVQVSVFASLDASLSNDDVPLAAPAMKHVGVRVAAGKIAQVTGKFTLPANIPPGNYFILVQLTVVSGFTGSVVSNAAVASVASVPVEWSFGAVGTRKNVPLVYVAADGTKETFKLNAGTGTLSVDGQGNLSVATTATSAPSSFSLAVSPASRSVTFASFTTDAAIGTLIAPAANLAGHLTIAGSAKTIKVKSLTSGFVGNIAGDLTTLAVSGDMTGDLTVAGSVKTITADNVTAGFNANIDGGLASFTARGSFTGDLTSAMQIGTLLVQGTMSNATILAGANFGSDGVVGGSGAAGDSFASGSIGTIHVVDNIIDSFVGAGVNPNNDVFGDGDDLSAGASLIRTIIAGRGTDARTRFEATTFGIADLPKKVIIPVDPRFIVL